MINSGKVEVLTGSDCGNRPENVLPVIAQTHRMDSAHRIDAHYHIRGQLIHVNHGYLQINVGQQGNYITAGETFWIPAGNLHLVSANDEVSYSSAFVHPDAEPGMSRSPVCGRAGLELLDKLKRLVSFGVNYSVNTPEYELSLKTAIAIREVRRDSVPLVVPGDWMLRKITDSMLANPAIYNTLSEWSGQAGVSKRTLERRFRQYTGCEFREWRQRLLVKTAVRWLLQGRSVTRVAFDLGYSSTSAFSVMFKRVTGYSPRNYLALVH